MTHLCFECDKELPLCGDCHNCKTHCGCETFITQGGFDADELGLDPESDNTPGDPSRHA